MLLFEYEEEFLSTGRRKPKLHPNGSRDQGLYYSRNGRCVSVEAGARRTVICVLAPQSRSRWIRALPEPPDCYGLKTPVTLGLAGSYAV